MSLKISGLTKTYKNGVKALDNVNLEIGKGMFGLLGPNGAGKSSLMRTIATLQTPSSGSVTFNDINVLEDKKCLAQSFRLFATGIWSLSKHVGRNAFRLFCSVKRHH